MLEICEKYKQRLKKYIRMFLSWQGKFVVVAYVLQATGEACHATTDNSNVLHNLWHAVYYIHFGPRNSSGQHVRSLNFKWIFQTYRKRLISLIPLNLVYIWLPVVLCIQTGSVNPQDQNHTTVTNGLWKKVLYSEVKFNELSYLLESNKTLKSYTELKKTFIYIES